MPKELKDILFDMTAVSVENADLDDRSIMLARLAALVAVDAPAGSYLVNLAAAADVGLEMEDVRQVLIAVAPIVGTPKIVNAAAAIDEALGTALGVA